MLNSFFFAMTKILMVCLGNICRSPIAHGLLEHKVKQHQLDVFVDSAGTSDYHIGEKPDERSIKKMNEYGIDITNQRARQFVPEDIEKFTTVYAMDYNNYLDIKNQLDHEPDNLDMILNLVYPNENMSVPDPYWSGEDGFENVYQLLDQATDKIIEDLVSHDG